MKSVLEFLNGKKTYITAALIAAAGIAAAFGYAVPEWIWASLAALGLTVNRVAVAKVADAVTAVKDEVQKS